MKNWIWWIDLKYKNRNALGRMGHWGDIVVDKIALYPVFC